MGLIGVVAVSDACDYPAEAALRARAARRRAPTGLVAASAPVSAGASSTASPVKPSAGSFTNLAALAASKATALHKSSSGLLGSHSSNGSSSGGIDSGNKLSTSNYAAANSAALDGELGPCWVDEQVLARERPGLIVYEDDDANDEDAATSISTATNQNQQQQRASIPSRSSLALTTSCRRGGSLGRGVAEAVVSVGLQRACRIVALHRSTLGDVLNAMLTVGEAAGVAEEANRAVDRLRARLRRIAGEAARAAEATAEPRPRVLVLRSVQPFIAEGLWSPDMITLAGGEPVGMQSGDSARVLSWPEVVQLAPDVIIVAGLRDGSGAKVFIDLCMAAGLPGWWLLPAVRSGAVFVCEAALIRRAGPRLVDGIEAVARMVHGDAVTVCCPPRAVLKLSLRPGQRCRPRLLPNYFMAFT